MLTLTDINIREAACELDEVYDTDSIDDAMAPYFEILLERLTTQHNLNQEQVNELEKRLAFRWGLLPEKTE